MIPYSLGSFSRRRNRKKLIEDLKAQQERYEIDQIGREAQVQELVEGATKKGFPKELAELVKAQMTPPTATFQIPDEETWRQNELDQLADRFAGSYIERSKDGAFIRAYDFTTLLPRCTRIENVGTESQPEVSFWDGEDQIEALGVSASIAFIRYCHFLGVFQLENAKKPCPECGDKPPQSCETCGGLGWIV